MPKKNKSKQSDIVISTKGLTKSFGDNHVLQGIDIKVQRGTMLALLGPNGAGKTTTVRILSTLLKPDSGKVVIEGYDLSTEPEKIRSVIGLTGQSAAVDELLTGRENLIMMGRLYRLTSDSAKSRAEELLEDFDLLEAAGRKTSTYSGGMRRRLDLAVSLIATPPVIFLDEPTTGLDPRSRLVMWDIIKKLMKRGTTILLTTQYLEEADQLADNIILIDDGKIVAEGTAKQLKGHVGKDRLVITFKNPKQLQASIKVLGKKVAFEDKENLQVTMLIESNGEDVIDILSALKKNKIDIASIDIHKPTLDDVFMTLTGKKDLSEDSKKDEEK
jgi:ABC-2 type transport system ATP-binding protein